MVLSAERSFTTPHISPRLPPHPFLNSQHDHLHTASQGLIVAGLCLFASVLLLACVPCLAFIQIYVDLTFFFFLSLFVHRCVCVCTSVLAPPNPRLSCRLSRQGEVVLRLALCAPGFPLLTRHASSAPPHPPPLFVSKTERKLFLVWIKHLFSSLLASQFALFSPRLGFVSWSVLFARQAATKPFYTPYHIVKRISSN